MTSLAAMIFYLVCVLLFPAILVGYVLWVGKLYAERKSGVSGTRSRVDIVGMLETSQERRIPMSDMQQIDSPDQRYFLLLASNEMRMSHWVTSAVLWERDPQRLLLEIGDWQWSSEQIVWSADSERVTIALRRYPGDAPGIVIDIYLERQIVTPHPPADTQPLSFAALATFLEHSYQQHRHARR